MSRDTFSEFRSRVERVFDLFEDRDADKEGRIRKLEEIVKTIIFYEERNKEKEARLEKVESSISTISDLVKSHTTSIELGKEHHKAVIERLDRLGKLYTRGAIALVVVVEMFANGKPVAQTVLKFFGL